MITFNHCFFHLRRWVIGFFSKNQVVFFMKKNWFFFNGFFQRFFFNDFFCTVFFKVDLVDKHSTRYDFIFFFSLIDFTSIQSLGRQKLTIMKWTQKDTVLKLLGLTLKSIWPDFTQPDFHLRFIMAINAITLHLKRGGRMQCKNCRLKRKLKHWIWYVNSSVFPSRGKRTRK